MKKTIAVLIPAYQANEALIDLVAKLVKNEIDVVIVNDGSDKDCDWVFRDLETMNCTVLYHKENKGKGAALKTGLSYLKENGYTACLTADADGQHSYKDVLNLIDEFSKNPNSLILGSRNVNHMPFKSNIGNSITRFLFKVLYNISLKDTQTGLRVIPFNDKFEGLINLQGDRYEYETNMLIKANSFFSKIIEVDIDTIYIDDNKRSSFKPIVDGMKIYKLLFSQLPLFLVASLSSFVVDFALFSLLFFGFAQSSFLATIVARLISAFFNYNFNKRIVFKSVSKKYTLLSYTGLAVAILSINSILMLLLVDTLSFSAIPTKIIIDLSLYILNFFVQSKLANNTKDKK